MAVERRKCGISSYSSSASTSIWRNLPQARAEDDPGPRAARPSLLNGSFRILDLIVKFQHVV